MSNPEVPKVEPSDQIFSSRDLFGLALGEGAFQEHLP